jgi:hypothetical protein
MKKHQVWLGRLGDPEVKLVVLLVLLVLLVGGRGGGRQGQERVGGSWGVWGNEKKVSLVGSSGRP